MHNARQRVRPSAHIAGDFGPYSKWELERARAELTSDVYGPRLHRNIKLKCGILADGFGYFSGCEPHPETHVSFESQSCSLLTNDNFPWIKESAEESCRYIQNGQFSENVNYETPGCSSSYERQQYGNNHLYFSNDDEDRKGYYANNYADFSRSQTEVRVQEAQWHVDRVGDVQTADNIRRTAGHYEEFVRSESPAPYRREIVHARSENAHCSTGLGNSAGPSLKRSRDSTDELASKKRKVRKTDESTDESTDEESDDVKYDAESVFNGRISGTDRSEEDKDITSVCYKCDLCDFMSTSSDTVWTHLYDAVHYSMSLYQYETRNGRTVPSHLLQRVVRVNKAALFKTLVPVCPLCHMVFSDVHICSAHYRFHHRKEKACYTLVGVNEIKNVLIPRGPKCLVCFESFKTFSVLNRHIAEQNHNILRTPNPREEMVMFCGHCVPYAVEYEDFSMCQDHLRLVHSDEISLSLMAIYFKKEGESCEMPPRRFIHGNKIVEKIKDDVDMLSKLQLVHSGKDAKRLRKKCRSLTKRLKILEGSKH